jgi:competence protein ComEA
MFETSLLFNSTSENTEYIPLWTTKKIRLLAISTMLISGIACTAWGTWLFFNKVSSSQPNSDQSLFSLEQDTESYLYIDVGGAVERPGLYSVKDGDRVSTAIEAAGGLSVVADNAFINTSLNLSARLKDEQKIYIPFEGESSEQEITETPLLASSDMNSSVNDVSLISINSASEEQLDELPKVGPATVEKIIAGRPYSAIDELLSRSIIGQSLFDEIKELIKI